MRQLGQGYLYRASGELANYKQLLPLSLLVAHAQSLSISTTTTINVSLPPSVSSTAFALCGMLEESMLSLCLLLIPMENKRSFNY